MLSVGNVRAMCESRACQRLPDVRNHPVRQFWHFCLSGLLAGLCVSPCDAQTGPEKNVLINQAQLSWKITEADCRYQVHVQRPVAVTGLTDGAEWFRFRAEQGSYLLAGQKIGAAQVIDELRIKVLVNASRPGLQVMARVVFPRSIDPRTGRVVTFLVKGTSHSRPESWQELILTNLPLHVQRQARLLRSELGTNVDERQAYVDVVYINLHAGTALTDVWLTPPVVEGGGIASSPSILSVGRTSESGLPNATNQPFGKNRDDLPAENTQTELTTGRLGSTARQTTPLDHRPSENGNGVRMRSGLLVVNEHPLFPCMIDHQGESFEFLKSTGFNTVRLANSPDPEQLDQARRLGLWLVSPPPALSGTDVISRRYDPVLAWDLGERLTSDKMDQVKRWTDQIHRAERYSQRPLVAQIENDYRRYSRYLDVFLLEKSPLGTSFELDELDDWIRERQAMARAGTPSWVVLDSQPLGPLIRQVAALSGTDQVHLDFSWEQIRLMAYRAVAAGARGIRFRSIQPLTGNESQPSFRRDALELVMRELKLFEPWAAGGAYVTTVNTSDPKVQATVISTDRAHLLLPIQSSPRGQFVVSPSKRQTLSIVVPGIPGSSQAFRLTEARFAPLKHRRVTGGVQVSLQDFYLSDAVVLTQDSLIISQLSRYLAANAGPTAALRRRIASQTLARVESICQSLDSQSQSVRGIDPILADVRVKLRQCNDLASTSDHLNSNRYANAALRSLARVRHVVWERELAGIVMPTVSPLLVSFETLPLHVALTRRLAAARPGKNLLAGGDFEDLQNLQRLGWKHSQHSLAELQAVAELSPNRPHAGGYSLRMHAWHDDGDSSHSAHVETPPVWITSGTVPLPAGRLVRIHGHVRVPNPITSSRDGLMIYDNIGGLSLALRIQHTGDWQRFVMYRVADRACHLQLIFSLTGLGEVYVDSVQVTPLESSVRLSSSADSTVHVGSLLMSP